MSKNDKITQEYMMPLDALTIAETAPLLKVGKLTPTDLLEYCFARLDVFEPHVRAWAFLNRDRARSEAQKLTEEIRQGHYRGPLHGIPIGIKDIIDVQDMPTGCGSESWANSIARQDATCVGKLRKAGALILGKTVTTPYAYLDPSQTRNPWNLERTPGGSSSGSAAAVASGMCLGALGTQTGGSVTRPATYCGVCSLKPTHQQIPLIGVLPLAPSLDHLGFFAQSVPDLVLLYEAFEKPYESGNSESRYLVNTTDDFWKSRTHPDVADSWNDFLRTFGDVPRVQVETGFDDCLGHHRTIMAAEAAQLHGERLARYPDDYRVKMRELIEHGQAVSEEELNAAYYFQRLFSASLAKGFRFLMMPAATDFAPTLETTGNPVLNAPWSFAGLPVVSLPIASKNGLPCAVQIIGQKGCEGDLLRVAQWIEYKVNLPRQLPGVPA